MSKMRAGRRAAFRLGFFVYRLDHQMTRLFDANDADADVLHNFEFDMDVVEESVFLLAEAHERAIVIEMNEFIRKMRFFFGRAYEELNSRNEPFRMTRVMAYETAGRIEWLSSLLISQDHHLVALYRFGMAIAAAATLASLGEGEGGDGWVDAKTAMEQLPERERGLAFERFSFERTSGEHLPETILDSLERYGWELSKLDGEVLSGSSSGGRRKKARQHYPDMERDKWCYEQMFSDKIYAKIVYELNQLAPSRGWRKFTSVQRLRQAARKYYLEYGLPPFPPRKNQ